MPRVTNEALINKFFTGKSLKSGHSHGLKIKDNALYSTQDKFHPLARCVNADPNDLRFLVAPFKYGQDNTILRKHSLSVGQALDKLQVNHILCEDADLKKFEVYLAQRANILLMDINYSAKSIENSTANLVDVFRNYLSWQEQVPGILPGGLNLRDDEYTQNAWAWINADNTALNLKKDDRKLLEQMIVLSQMAPAERPDQPKPK